MRIIAVVNQKGGVGKTTTSVNLGAALALRGRRVLLIDMDPQGNLTDHLLGDRAPDAPERGSVYDVLVEGASVSDCVVPTATPLLFVVPSHEDMAGAELDLAAVIGREVILRDALAELETLGAESPSARFDFVFLDCPPSLGLLSLNALAAANEVFIALQTEFFAMRGLSALDRTIDLVRRRINPGLRLGGIVPTLVDPTRLSREVMDEVRSHYADRVFATRVRTNIRLAEAPSYGRHIFDYAPDSAGAADYAALAAEVEHDVAAADPEVGPAGAALAATPSPGTQSPSPTGPPATKPEGTRPAPKRGIARAIAEAAAAVGVPAAEPAPRATSPDRSRAASQVERVAASAEAQAPSAIAIASPVTPMAAMSDVATPAATPESEAPTPAPVAAALPPPIVVPVIAPVVAPTAGTASSVSVAAVAAGSPSLKGSSTTAIQPGRRIAVTLPVVRPGARPLSIPPMPTRPPSALPRPEPAAAVAVANGAGSH